MHKNITICRSMRSGLMHTQLDSWLHRSISPKTIGTLSTIGTGISKFTVFLLLTMALIMQANASGLPETQNNLSRFQSALDNYFQGKYSAAEEIYSGLLYSGKETNFIIPVALNYVAQGKKNEALKLFDEVIYVGQNQRNVDYALLWEIMLIKEKKDTEKLSSIKLKLKKHIWLLPYEQSLFNLYTETGNVEDTFSAIDDMQTLPSFSKSDAITESVWFIYNWLLLSDDKDAAAELFAKYSKELNTNSLEYRLLLDINRIVVNKDTDQ